MYDPALDVFKAVADNGSFSKAAEKLFITHTAVIKQINQMEARLGVRLFTRSSRGAALTEAGRRLYEEALEIMKFSREALARVRRVSAAAPRVIRVGNSPLYPCQAFLELWESLREKCPQYQLQVVPFLDDKHHVDESYDLIVGAYDKSKTRRRETFLPLGAYRFHLAMARSHPLAGEKSLRLEDLAGQTVQIMDEGRSPSNDEVRHSLLAACPGAELEIIPAPYDMNTFNHCAESGSLLLSLECWKDVHPALVSLPLEGDFACPYGVIAAVKPAEDVRSFLQAVAMQRAAV